MDQQPDHWLTVAEIAAAYRVSKMTIYRAINDGELPAIRWGRMFRVKDVDVESFIKARAVPAAAG
jgi:excisionase family DNA binding protein